ncbi:MAG: hypothetical protein K8I02_07560, partial [Candidatus Methylomirabilis sp.]|nr:hypothetical protein [Deltaproteobacteria bacterium]
HVYVAANDGGLHNFRVSDGYEQWKFIPENVISKLTTFWSTSYCHRYYVDGTPKAADVKIDVTQDGTPEWVTFLVGGQRSGGGAYVGLDVTDPTAISPRWQYTHASLGEAWSEPRFGRVKIGGVDKWVVFVGSGPNNSDTKGYLFAINLEDGSTLYSVKLSDTTSNQATSPQIIDVDADDYIDYVYVGDLAGKLWRIDVRDGSTTNWTKTLLFQADSNQAIMGSPALTIDNNNKVRVYFGTGKYLTAADKTTTYTQTFYGVIDPGNGTTVLKTNFANQTTTDNVMTGKDGWYFNLPSSGDRVTTEPDLLGGFAFFTSFVPDSSACGVGGSAKLFAVDYLDGTAPDSPVLDVDGDGDVDSADKTSGVIPKYVSLGDGVPSKPVIDTKNQQIIVQTS